MASIDLYYISTSPPCRAVMMTAYMVGVNVNLKLVNLLAGEQMKPEFLKMNPQHNVPTMADNNFYLNESRAICAYLVNKYGKNVNHLYPEDAAKRGIIDQRLHFDAAVLFPSLRDTYVAFTLGRIKSLDEKTLKPVHDGLGFLNGMLQDHEYAAGSCLTIADLSLVATVSSIDAADDEMIEKYPNVKAWLHRCKTNIKCYDELNEKGAQLMGQWIKQATKSQKI